MTATYNVYLVALSFGMSVLGSFTAMQLATNIPLARGRSYWLWLTGAAMALGGGGIWTMHFIGMLAYELPMTITYDIPLTIASLVLAILVVGVGFAIVGRSRGRVALLLLAGLLTGLGVSTMHYTGMAAMEMGGSMRYDMNIVYLSIAIAVVAATAALWLAFNMRGGLQRFASAIVMGIAVCGMHYTGMAAVIIDIGDMDMSSPTIGGMSPEILAIWVSAGALVVVGGLLIASLRLARATDHETYQSLPQ